MTPSFQELIGKIESGATASGSVKPDKKSPTAVASVEAETEAQAQLAANPAAKKLAEENNIDLATLKGTGKGGRILKEDVQNALAVPKVRALSPPPPRFQRARLQASVLRNVFQ